MKHQWTEDTSVSDCLTGCKVRGEHKTECLVPCSEECARRCREHCTGCRPHRSEEGSGVCKRCRERVSEAIPLIPKLVTWIGTQDTPSTGSQRGPTDKPIMRTKKSPPLPFAADAVDAADALHALLASWCRIVVEERPGNLTGPDLRGSVSSRRVLADDTGDIIGLGVSHAPRHAAGRTRIDEQHLDRLDDDAPGLIRVQVTNWTDRLDDKGQWGDADWVVESAPTQRAADWLMGQLDWALAQPFAGDLVREISEATWTTRRRWPIEAEPIVAEAECFNCGNKLVRLSGDDGYENDFRCTGCPEKYDTQRYNQALADLRQDKRAAMDARIEAGQEEADDDLVYVAIEDAVTWTGRKAWTIRGWAQQGLIRRRTVGSQVQVHLYDVTREHNTRGTRARSCTESG